MNKVFVVLMISASVLLGSEKPNDFLGAEHGDYSKRSDNTIIAAIKKSSVISLAGKWHCELDPNKKGIQEKWFSRELPNPIRLPGILDEAGYGKENNKRSIAYLNRKIEYIGPAWYQRDVNIPRDWANKRITLVLERVMWESQLWIDNRALGTRDSLITPHIYDLTDKLTPGEHIITIRVNNEERPGASCHGYGDQLQTRWNGLLGSIELVAQDLVNIQNVQIYPELAQKQAIVRVTVGNMTNESADGTVIVTSRLKKNTEVAWSKPVKANFKISGESLPIELVLKIGDNAALWDEFNPNLYEVKTEVFAKTDSYNSYDTKLSLFGMRQITQSGTQLVMNNQTLFLRGTHDGGGFPLTGYPATDVNSWRRIFQICKDYGLNHVRYHSFCPPEAAFIAADEKGIMLQVELPYWGNVRSDWAGTAFLRAELLRALDAYGNHPSFVLMTMGNEHSGDWDVLAHFVSLAKNHDPRHLYAASSNEYLRMKTDPRPGNDGDDFAIAMQAPVETGYQKDRIRMMEILLNGETPAFNTDYRDIVKKFNMPIISHEVGQYWIFPDMNEIKKYTGVLKSGAFEMFCESMQKSGLTKKALEFHQASGALAIQLYKEDIERQLRTPYLGGFQLLDLHDYSGQNTSLIGILDAFWDSKGLITPEQFREFCAPTVVLARLPKIIWSEGESFRAEAEVAHYGPTDLNELTTTWKMIDANNSVVDQGTLSKQGKVSKGRNTKIGYIEKKLQKTGLFRLYIKCDYLSPDSGNMSVQNSWQILVVPSATEFKISGNVRITENPDTNDLRFVEEGGRLLVLGYRSKHTVPIDFSVPIWNAFLGTVQTCGLLIDNNHPALSGFPSKKYSTWQWYELLEPQARAFVLSDMPADYDPIVTVIDQPLRAFRLGAIWEVQLGKGTLLATSLDITNDLDNRIGARQLRRSILEYLSSDKCNPSLKLNSQQVMQVLKGDHFEIVSGIPESVVVKLDVQASRNISVENESLWEPQHDRVILKSPGFDYTLPTPRWSFFPNIPPRVCWFNQGHAAWMGEKFTLRLNCPKDFAGTAYFYFHDEDSGTASGFVEYDRDAFFVGPHDGAGKWVAFKIETGDTANGPIELHFGKPAGGPFWVGAPRVTRLLITED